MTTNNVNNSNKNNVNANGFEFVDLGLPSGTLWATANVGADEPTDCGQYFDWNDDIAYAHMGGGWHMPTPEQFKELVDNTIGIFFNYRGVNGRIFISKKDTSKYIFIPAAGVSLDGKVRELDRVWIWTKKNDGHENVPGYFFFDYEYTGFGEPIECERNYKHIVRGVIG